MRTWFLALICSVSTWFLSDIFLVANAQESFDPESVLQGIKQQNPNLEVVPDSQVEGGHSLGVRLLVNRLIQYGQIIIAAMGVFFIIIQGILLLFSGENEEAFSKRKTMLFWMVVGFLILLSASVLVDKFFFGAYGEVIENPQVLAQRGLQEIIALFEFLAPIIIAIAVLFLVFGAIKLIIKGDEEEEKENAIRQIIYSVIGILIIINSKIIVLNVITRGGLFTLPEGESSINFLLGLINYALGFVGFLAVIAIIWAGVLMVTHFGDEEKTTEAKNIIKYAVYAIFLAFSSWSLVQFFLYY